MSPFSERVRHFIWLWLKNGRDAWSYRRSSPRHDVKVSALVRSLKSRGVVVASEIAEPSLYTELSTECQQMLKEAWDDNLQRPRANVADGKGDRSKLDAIENKDFLLVLTPKTFRPDSIFLRYALQPRFIEIADAYLGLRCQLRAVHLWLNYANDGEPSSTQLWHRDGDDYMNLKIFTYLTDVDELHGPFTFIPGSQPLGFRHIEPESSKFGRTNDAQMTAHVNSDQWEVCTGPAGSVVFADTCGYHKGLKPRKGYRLLLMAHYTSRAAVSAKEIQLVGDAQSVLSKQQLAALN